MIIVCAVDGVELQTSRAGRLVHLGGLPEGVDPDHDPVEMAKYDYEGAKIQRDILKDAALDMLTHHDAIHPPTDCAFRARLYEALRT